MIYGVLLIAAPFIGALVLAWWLGAYAIVFGFALMIEMQQLVQIDAGELLGQFVPLHRG